MIIKIETARKGGYGAANYVMGGMDSQGRDRACVDVLQGDPERFRMLTSCLPFEETYSSLEISFHINDAPTHDEVNAVARDVVAITTLGRSPFRTDHLVVKHTSTSGRVDVHILVPRVDLVTGDSFNPTPPEFSKPLMRLQTAWNAEKGWADPLAANRRRLFKLPRPPSPHNTKALARCRWERDWIETVSKEVIAKVKDGRIRSHLDVVRHLALSARVEAIRPDQLIVHVPYQAPGMKDPTTRKITLRGKLYGTHFDALVVKDRISYLDAPPVLDHPRPQDACTYRQAHETWLADRADFLEQQFAPSSKPRVRAPDRIRLPVGPAKHLCAEEDRQAFERLLEQAMKNRPERPQHAAKCSSELLPDRDQASPDASGPVVMDAEAMAGIATVTPEATEGTEAAMDVTNFEAMERADGIKDTDEFDHPGGG